MGLPQEFNTVYFLPAIGYSIIIMKSMAGNEMPQWCGRRETAGFSLEVLEDLWLVLLNVMTAYCSQQQLI